MNVVIVNFCLRKTNGRVLLQNRLSTIFEYLKVRKTLYKTKKKMPFKWYRSDYDMKWYFSSCDQKYHNFIFLIFQELQSQISQIDLNGFNPFCNQTLQLCLSINYRICSRLARDSNINNDDQDHTNLVHIRLL